MQPWRIRSGNFDVSDVKRNQRPACITATSSGVRDGEDQGLQYYAMQLIDGVTLAEVVRHLQTARTLPGRSADPQSTRNSPSEVTTHSEMRGSSHRVASTFATEDAVLQLFGTTMTQSVSCPSDIRYRSHGQSEAGTNPVRIRPVQSNQRSRRFIRG